MGYDLPAQVPAWTVEVYGLAISIPFVASRVGWLPSSSHPVKTFRSLEAAQRHAGYIEDRAKLSLVPIEWRGEIKQTARTPDLVDKLRAFLNMRPLCGDLGVLYDTKPLG